MVGANFDEHQLADGDRAVFISVTTMPLIKAAESCATAVTTKVDRELVTAEDLQNILSESLRLIDAGESQMVLLRLDPSIRLRQRFLLDWRRSEPSMPSPELLAKAKRSRSRLILPGLVSYMSQADVAGRKIYDEELKARMRDNG